MKGHLHVHTQHSLNDSTIKIPELVAKAKEMGMDCLAMTNHGNLLGMDQFLAQADGTINLIPGCELYFGKERRHLVVLAKNIEGYHDLCDIVTEANHPDNFVQNKSKWVYPITTFENLKKHVQGKNNLIALSACIQGIIADILLTNVNLEKKLKKCNSNDEISYLRTQKAAAETAVVDLKEKRKTDAKTAASMKKRAEEINTKFVQFGIDQITDEEKKYFSTYRQLINNDEIIESTIKSRQAEIAEIDKKINPLLKKSEKYSELLAQKKDDSQLWNEAVEMVNTFKSIFGENNFFIEIQNHGIDKELYVMPLLAKLAAETNTPLVATNDVHILDNSDESILARSVIKFNGFGKWMGIEDGDKELYLKSDDEMKIALSRVLTPEQIESAMNNITYIQQQCHVEAEKKQYHYPKFQCEDAEAELRRCAFEGLQRRYGNRPDIEKIKADTEYELSVINKMGFADYLLIVKDFLEFGRKAGHLSYENTKWLKENMRPMTMEQLVAFVNERATEPGESIGPGRGSAAGSKVCYELGITNIDPTKYDLMFERFLNPDRVSMPDIDSDFSDEVRKIVIEYCRKKYGYDAVCGINTVQVQAAKGAVRMVARAIIAKVGNNEKEAMDEVKKDYYALADAICKQIPKGPKVKLEDCVESLASQFGDNKNAMEIIRTAQLIEGTITTTGTHAAGVIISDTNVSKYISLMWDPDNLVYKTQCDMIAAEGTYGLLKMDFLGLKTLNIITMTLRLIQEIRHENIDIDNIPVEPEVINDIYVNTLTNGVFQFMSPFMKSTLKKIQPKTIDDLILVNAIGRPGPMDYIDEIAAVKAGIKKPSYLIPEVEAILGKTYGYPVYQEQIMQLMQLAGMTMGEADNIRRHMSKKHTEEFMAAKPQFVDGMVAKGANLEETEAFWDSIVNFSKYAFNKSHAAAYVVVSYQTAWLKYHYPAEYLCSALEYEEEPKNVPGLIDDAKKLGVDVLAPDILRSKKSYSVIVDTDGKEKILFGLTAIRQCGDKLQMSNIKDAGSLPAIIYNLRDELSNAVVLNLIGAGAFDRFSPNREAMCIAANACFERLNNIKKQEKKLAEKKQLLDALNKHQQEIDNGGDWREILASEGIVLKVKNCPQASKVQTIIDKTQEQLDLLLKNYSQIEIGTCHEDKKARLKKEHEMLGLYVSGHPVDSYVITQDITEIGNLGIGRASIIGFIKNLAFRNRKADGKPMAFFDLEDKSGSIHVCVFTKAYAECQDVIKEGRVVIVNGTCHQSDDEMAEEGTLEMSANSVVEAKEKESDEKESIIVTLPSIDKFIEFRDNVLPLYIDEENGFPLVISIANLKLYQTPVKVTQAIRFAQV